MPPPLTKDASIVDLLTRLEHVLGAGSFVVADYWDADLCAIGIASAADSNAVVYLSTYGPAPDRFHFECELVNPNAGPDEMPYKVSEEREDASFDELVAAIRRHFR
jgi:hypothetical protein